MPTAADTASLLARALPGVRRSAEPVDTLAYARDLWPRHHIEVRGGSLPNASRPALVVWPRSTEEVASVVRVCAGEGVHVVPFGAGSGVCAGVLPTPSSVVIDLKAMGARRSLDPRAPLLDVEAGALGITLEETLAREGWTVGHFPSSILCSTVGGWLAARGAGQCSGKYGKIEDMVASLEMVDGRGEVRTLHRRAEGPDLTPLVIGSEGTLGVITSARLRLHPAPVSRAFSSFAFPTLVAGWEALRALFQAGLRPAVARLYDPFDTMMARRGGVKREGHPKGKGRGLAALTPVLRAPRFLNGVVDALGDRAFGGSLLVLIFEGAPGDTDEDDARAAAVCAAGGGKPLGDGPARRWYAHRYSVSYRQQVVFRAGAFSDTMEVAATWSRLGALYEGVRRALGKHVFVMAHLSHAYPDGCSIYFTFAGAAKDDREAAAIYDAAWRDALAAAYEAGGTISHHHGIGRSKAPRLPSELGAGVGVVRGVQRAFDPAGIMNPGALLPPNASAPTPPSAPASPDFAVDEVSLLATLPGTMTLDEARRRLDDRGFVLPAGPAAEGAMTIAAWLAGGARGAPDPWLDPVDHLLAGLSVDLPAGRRVDIRPTPRRAAGPDLTSLWVGGGVAGEIRAAHVRVSRRGAPSARPIAFAGERHAPLSADEDSLVENVRAAAIAL